MLYNSFLICKFARTLAVKISAELFDRLKEYLEKNHLKQKDFITQLIQQALDKDVYKRQDHGWWEFDYNGYSASLTASMRITPDSLSPTATAATMKMCIRDSREIVPYVVIDCSSYIANDILSAVALMEADSVLQLASCDLKSVGDVYKRQQSGHPVRSLPYAVLLEKAS